MARQPRRSSADPKEVRDNGETRAWHGRRDWAVKTCTCLMIKCACYSKSPVRLTERSILVDFALEKKKKKANVAFPPRVLLACRLGLFLKGRIWRWLNIIFIL